MTDTDQNQEDEVLKRMLRTPHQKHEPTTALGKRRRENRSSGKLTGGVPDYVVIDGAFFAAKIIKRDDRSMVADLYRNDADYRAGKAMERSVSLVYSSPAQ